MLSEICFGAVLGCGPIQLSLMPKPRIEAGGEPLACCVHAAAMKQIVCDGRRPIGTVALDDDTGLFEGPVWCMPFDCS